MGATAYKALEGIFTIAFVGLVLLNFQGFNDAVTGLGTAYRTIVLGLQSPGK